MATKKDIKYYMNLNWSYTIEQETHKGKHYYIIRVNELPGICTDAETIEEGMRELKDAIAGAIKLYLKNKEPIPEPIKKEQSKDRLHTEQLVNAITMWPELLRPYINRSANH